MKNHRWKRAVVIGASSGIGEAITRQLADGGTAVALVARRMEVLESICQEINAAAGEQRAFPYRHDVHETAEARPILQHIMAERGSIDLVVYSAGITAKRGPDEYPTDVDVDIVDTNFTGAVAWLNAAAEHFHHQQAGTIVGVSSIAGERGRRGSPVYNATKAGFNAYLEGLRCRLAARGVTVLTAKPGWVRTPMIGDSKLPLPAVSPEQAAREILSAAAAGRRVVYVPGWWRLMAIGMHSIPAPIFERVNIP